MTRPTRWVSLLAALLCVGCQQNREKTAAAATPSAARSAAAPIASGNAGVTPPSSTVWSNCPRRGWVRKRNTHG